MKTIYDIQQVLKRYGTYIYTGDRIGDLELMKLEIRELYQAGFIQVDQYQLMILIINKEARIITKRKRNEHTNG